MQIPERIAEELKVRAAQVEAAVSLLDGGATVPFIARYRKEAHGALDDTQLRYLEERLRYLRELEAERSRILEAIGELGLLTADLEARIREADTKARLEDLYLPFRPKRRTKAQIAREAGIGALLDSLLADPAQNPQVTALAFVDAERGFADVDAVLEGAENILLERAVEDADLVEEIRERLRKRGRLCSRVIEGKEQEGAKFRDWFDFQEPFATVPSHRVLALFRGQEQGVLDVRIQDEDAENERPWIVARVTERLGIRDQGRATDAWLVRAARNAARFKVGVRAELSLADELRRRAEEEAIRIFASNLRDLLLAAPAGPQVVIGLDPGVRTGVKVAVVDRTGKLIDTETVYPFQPKNDLQGTRHVLARLIEKHGATLIAIGNGTGSRETERIVVDLLKDMPNPRPTKVIVSEAGASVYSASELASLELPGVDVTLRGAASIARRLQDPLAELVKIDPRSIGVGQYQHDVSPVGLERSLDAVVEDCVNAVGVDLNTASPALLTRVAGLGAALARNVVAWRDQHGAFKNRRQLLEVERLGPKTFEQCAGFLRIRESENPLDASAVHPEAYPVVERIVKSTGRPIHTLLGDAPFLRSLRPETFTDEKFGVPTVKDILGELEKPGRDPRPEFKTATFKDGVETMADLQPGMMLEGTVTNVTAFGAFVDIGVHQDGLVHVSALADRFVKDPREVVHTGDIVHVRVVEVDCERKRIALTMKSEAIPKSSQDDRRGQQNRRQERPQERKPAPKPAATFGSFADLLKPRR